MSVPDGGFAPPPFKPDEALARLKRELRELGLAEREGVFERRGLAIARLRIDVGTPVQQKRNRVEVAGLAGGYLKRTVP